MEQKSPTLPAEIAGTQGKVSVAPLFHQKDDRPLFLHHLTSA
jgi:hypothetical protein